MGLLGKLGHAALDALDMAARLADKARASKHAPGRPKADASPAPPETEAASSSAPEVARAASKRSDPKGLGNPEVAAQVFGRMSCSFTHRARRLLEDRGIAYEFTELDAPEGFALAPKLRSSTGQRTVPYVFLRGRFVGGFDGLDEIDRLGMLDDMSKSAEERSAGGGSSIRVVAPPPRRD